MTEAFAQADKKDKTIEPKQPQVGRVVSAQAWECPDCKRLMAIPEKSDCDCGRGISPAALYKALNKKPLVTPTDGLGFDPDKRPVSN